MQLVQLVIKRDKEIVRDIRFKQGLNLILDKPTEQSTQSGNNVGKTTVLRLIDFCFGSDGDDIWQDSEFKKNINQEVYNYLHGTLPVSVKLVIKRASGMDCTLTRLFALKKHPEPIFFVDDTVCRNISEYRKLLKKTLFNSDGAKPSVRQLIPKFVRSSQALMGKTLKFLGDFASETDYEATHLFLFGFLEVDVLDERPVLAKTRKNLERDLLALTRLRTEGEVEQLLLHLRREVEEIGLSNQLRAEVPEIASRANEVSSIRARAARITGVLGRLEAEIASIQMAIQNFENEYSDVDRYPIEAVYREANKYIPKLHHDWDELKDFVQNLRRRKQRFLESQIRTLQEQVEKAKQELSLLQAKERSEINSLFESHTFNKALEVRSDLQEKLKRLGSLEQDLQDIHDLKGKLEEVNKHLKITKDKIEEGKSLLRSRVAIFNKYFSALSKSLYGEQYLLHFDDTEKGALSFRLTAIGSNVGSGKKVSQTAAFDLAYMKFVKETELKFPRFVCHDGVESVHGNQLNSLLTAGNEIDGQLIIATLRDKLPDMPKDFIEENTIVALSQEDRLFRL